MTTLGEIKAAVAELDKRLSEGTESTELADVADAIERRATEELKTFVAADDQDETAIDKWFRHKRGGDWQESDVEVLYQDADYLLVRSEMWSNRKAKAGDDDDGRYHAAWVVGYNDYTRFFVHRLEWSKAFESTEPDNWDRERVLAQLGFDEMLPSGDEPLATDTTYLVQGDLTMTVQDIDDLLADYVDRLASYRQRDRKRSRRDEYDALVTEQYDHPSVSISGPSPVEVTVKTSSTDELRAIQTELGIAEETIRERMDPDWQRLSGQRRQRLLEDLIAERVDDELPVVDEEAVKEEAREDLTAAISDTQQVNLPLGNHLVVLEDAVSGDTLQFHGLSRRLTGQQFVPSETTLEVLHDEHDLVSRSIGPCVVSFDLLDRHDRA